MNTSKRVVLDVSPFLLLEASADSEAGHNHVEDEETDESCSEASTSRVTWTSQRPIRLGTFEAEDHTVVVEEERDAAEEDEEDGEGEVNSYIRCGRSSSQCQNLATVLTEMDQSRMFWEACLAS